MKRMMLLFAILLGVMFLFSSVVSMSEARLVAENCFLERTGVKEKTVSIEPIGDRAEPSYYFCYLPNGFVIIAGETRVKPILGFSEGNHQGKEIPPQLQRLLRQFKEEIEYARNQSMAEDNEMWEHYLEENFVPNVMLRNVAALLTTTWDQNQYYNDQCPVDASGPGGHAYAGCAATAMGQVMKYHDYPESGVGSHSYTHATYGTLSANFGTTSYDWTNMPNMLSGISNSTQIAAVAELLYHCGVSIEMNYGPDGSGAWIGHTTDPNAADALVNYFDYKSSLQYVQKSNYSDAAWHTLLQTDLDNGLPILYAGWDEPTEGHAWVCDGYNASNEYHMNWGWSGSYNGFFALTSLQPGSMPNFINWQEAVIGIEPDSNELGTASNPSPSDGATEVSVNTMITWTNGANTEDVDVYFSSNQTLVTNKDTSVRIYSGTAITGIDPNGVMALSNDTTYYWRIVCKNSAKAETDGPVWSFTTEGTGTVEAILSYYPDISYYMPVPDGNGILKFGVYYTPADECDLTKIKTFFYGTDGNPVSCDLKVYDALDDGTGTEYPNNLLHTENIPIASIVAGMSEPEFTLSTPIHFNAGENFFITYEIVGTNPTDVVNLLRSNGSTDGVEGSHSICEYSGNWYYHTDLWGTPFEVAMEATVEYAATIPPNLEITPASIAFGQTAIGGWKTQNVMMKNIGGGQLVVSAPVFSGDPSIQLYDDNTYPVTLTSGQSASVMIAYGPDAVGQNSANLTITDDTGRAIHEVPITGEGYEHNSWASLGSSFDQSPMGTQGDYSWSMSTSDQAPGYLLAENFWGLPAPIKAIEFWGINWFHDGSQWVQLENEDPMTFEIKFYDDHPTDYEPGIEQFSFTLDIYREEVVDSTFSGGPVYCYRTELPQEVPIADGWVSIQGISVGTPDDAWFLWSQSPIGDLGNTPYDYGTSTWGFNAVDLAFALFTELPFPPMDVNVANDGLNTTVTWNSEPDYHYAVYSDTDAYGPFDTLAGYVTDGSGTFVEASVEDMKFYRVSSITHDVSGRQERKFTLPLNKKIQEYNHKQQLQNNETLLK